MRTSLDAVSSARQKITNGLSKVAHRFDPERPATARSKAGVFGALQASAMGLGGVAAPSATGIAPAAQSPDFGWPGIPVLPAILPKKPVL
ncbi:hypothetical protein Pst134EA_032097 [Puccinia striiformis f. sp. tritici]|uniref:uncharacterized protein n=1 Tax=Puccinia striiformis f. sp. tritici TaxID=168172 RepID=UPI002007B411|nr:uncharacterized protein Pst134EA_032097 [Puccinia striiformis f. sp. tritici]KAH9441900.1 hypothetical protein Pst134EA_032097 [Puccinia striiformis f. sp. tritici]